jgi:hypothetical protein
VARGKREEGRGSEVQYIMLGMRVELAKVKELMKEKLLERGNT